jgi:hypothetical protein
MSKRLKGVMVWSIDTDDFEGNCLLNAKIYDDFENKLKEMQRDPFFKTIVNELNLPNGGESMQII